MRFITLIKSNAGKYKSVIKAMKAAQVPPGIEILHFLGSFGEYDGVLLFDAPNEKDAASFVVQFGDNSEMKTSVVFPIEDYTWVN